SESSTAVPGVSRSHRLASRGGGVVETGAAHVPAAPDLQESETAGAEVAAAHGPHQGVARGVPGRPLRPHPPPSARGVPVDDEPVEVAVPHARAANADLRRPGGAGVPDVCADVRTTGSGPQAGGAGALLRTALRGAGPRLDGRDAEDLRAPGAGRVRGDAPAA